MKRIVITILSAFVGLFGFTVVDTAIESRITSLESRVYNLESMVESYHNILTEVITTKPASNVFTTKMEDTTLFQAIINN